MCFAWSSSKYMAPISTTIMVLQYPNSIFESSNKPLTAQFLGEQLYKTDTKLVQIGYQSDTEPLTNSGTERV